jgi:hydroxymethylglutaryl-CoA lyase
VSGSGLPATIEIVDVGPRDGLQDEPALVSTADKVAYIQAIRRAGIRRIEVASFVNPRRVPQMADAEAVIAALEGSDIDAIGLVLNERGLDRALEACLHEINTVVVVTDTFSRQNQGMTTAESIAMWQAVSRRARAARLRTGLTLSAAFGCPFEGRAEPRRVIELARDLAETADEISVADTIGAAVPTQVGDVVEGVRDATGLPVRVHLHNSRNAGSANAVAAVAAGAAALDASTGGIGGCPFAPGATGNVATEDVVWMLQTMGVDTGADVALLLEAVAVVERVIGRQAPGMLSRAGIFPRTV